MSRAILVTGWRGARRIQERVDLHEVELVTRKNNSRTANLVLTKEDGEEHTLKVTAPGIWRMQIDYRLRRIATAAAAGLKARVPRSVERSDLPTADEVETASQASREERDSLDERFFHEELGEWPRFESESAPGIGIAPMEVSEGDHDDLYEEDLELTSELETLEGGEVMVEDEVGVALVQEFALDSMPEIDLASEEPAVEGEDARAVELEVEAAVEATPGAEVEATAELGVEAKARAESEVGVEAEARAESEAELAEEARLTVETTVKDEPRSGRPAEEDLHPIGDDIVLDEAMDATSAGDVVLDWLEPATDLGSVALAGSVSGRTGKSEVQLEGAADIEAEAEYEAAADLDAQSETISEQDAGIQIVAEPEASAEFVAGTDIEIVEEHSGVIDLVPAIEPPEAELDAELLPAVEAELRAEHSPAVEAELDAELSPAVEAELDAELSPAAEAELSADLSPTVETELRGDLSPTVDAELSAEPAAETELRAEAPPSREIGESAARSLPIAARPFSVSRVYDRGEEPSTESTLGIETPAETDAAMAVEPAAPEHEPAAPEPATPEREAEPKRRATDLPAEPRTKDLSVEPPAGPSRRQPIRDLADLRPMSLADLIKQSEPTWTRLAEMD